jgi:hypothetical protein
VLFLQTMLLATTPTRISMRAAGPTLAVGIHVVLLITAGLTRPLSITGLTAPDAAERVWIDEFEHHRRSGQKLDLPSWSMSAR